ncbi:hypothetical protein VB780_27365 [Leptolyngbya sp. CCNP1308]|uniref:hypothetical protein n=1 Tax=Leptolyngbya sp. CCNP1308 TaxID=3110255 RepID=UPI002B20FB19|nr:hypothetical protein [Leptolyngbya sp. CCNP1308]MEA5452324.1 hypothetical protein [Leptolyngbya sp. CCNP1308]
MVVSPLRSAATRNATGMNTYLIFWILGFGILWSGLRLFDDEVFLIVTLIVGCGLVLAGLISAPATLQIVVEVVLVIALFHICMECISRGNRS